MAGIERSFKDMPEDEKIALIKDQLDGIRFGELTIVIKYGQIHGYKYVGEQKFFHTKPEQKKDVPVKP